MKKPIIKITWEDYPENRTLQKEKSIKEYFERKYNAQKVMISFKSKKRDLVKAEDILSLSDNIIDPANQRKLLKIFSQKNKSDIPFDLLIRLDDKVNSKIDEEQVKPSYKKWKLNKLEVDNFLSFGDGNVIDYSRLKGFTIFEGTNFQGKTIILIDALMFLLFNTTTRTSKASEIFNLYRKDKDTVSVKGEIEIDDEKYIIERIITRKRKKGSLEYTVKTDLNFYKILPSGEIENLNGEQRQKTDKIIADAIGSQEDFLLTILSDGRNLEDLIQAKATECGNIFTRFLGIDILSKKEEVAKNMLSEFKQKMKSNHYSIEQLKNDNGDLEIIISNKKDEITIKESSINKLNLEIQNLEQQKEKLLSQKILVDKEIEILTKEEIETNIEKQQSLIDLKSATIIQRNSEIEQLRQKLDGASYNDSVYTKLIDQKHQLSLDYNTLEQQKITLEKEKNSLTLEIIGETKLLDELDKINENIDKLSNAKDAITVSFDNNQYQDLKSELEKIQQQETEIKTLNRTSNETITTLEESSYCPMCKREYDDISHNQQEIERLKALIKTNNKKLIEIGTSKALVIEQIVDLEKTKEAILEKERIDNNLKLLLLEKNNINDKLSAIKKVKQNLEDVSVQLENIDFSMIKQQLQLVQDQITEQLNYKLWGEEITKIELNLYRFKVEIENYQLVLSSWQDKLRRYIDSQKAISQNRELNLEILNLDTQIKTIRQNKESILSTISLYQSNIEQNLEKIEANKILIQKLISEEEILKTFQFYIKAFGKNGISKMVISDIIPKINEELELLLDEVSDFNIVLELNDKQEIEINMIDKDTDVKKPVKSGSGYQRTASAVALRCVLTKVSVLPKPDFIVFDEVLDKVALDNLQFIEKLFMKVKENFDKVFLITHVEQAKDWGDNLVVVKKENNISKIYY